MKTYTLPPRITLVPTTRDDIDTLPGLELAAARRFVTLPDLAWIADGPVQDRHQHRACADAGQSWVARHNAQPVGFILTQPMDAALFILELSVHPDWQGKGIGRALIATAAEAARQRGFHALTLTTFLQVPWNAPFYAGLGFEVLEDTALTPELRERRETETAHGLAWESRCAMRLIL